MGAKRKEINLIPKEYIQAQQIKRLKRLVLGLLIIETIVFMGTAVVSPYLDKKYEQAVLNELEYMKTDPKYVVVNKKIAELNEAKQDLEFWSQKYNQLKEKSFVSTELLDGISARLPLGMKISSLSLLDTQSVKIEGESESEEPFSSYLVLLESTYGEASIVYSLSEEEERYRYHIELQFPVPLSDEANAAEATETNEEGMLTMNEAMQTEAGGEE
ncbi:hypothetical protein CS063_02365 [Sporanaerobium hydrogeniformans]|uniref:Uncharacterized protein n=1 Tax=Sporanaerobium hydrogeniformans TaxID=3072179 RepID=A0AC61DII2_9FIRM|nr:hypothetical protein [Sporanaerobium hydrogeniformans]PHV72341.1 hypothetical protein CS063_02365 [Sporanaerobium hydrogeniformans]